MGHWVETVLKGYPIVQGRFGSYGCKRYKNMSGTLFSIYTPSLLILIAVVCSMPQMVSSTIRIPSIGFVLPPIYWKRSNPIFRRDNTLHIIDVQIGDSIDIVCPQYSKATNPDQIEYHAVYMVTKDEYDSCYVDPNMDPSKTRLILNCSEPAKTQIFTISFRDFSPIPQGLEFRRGRDYYFISTSKGTLDGINNLEGGYCKSHAMKVMFKVGPRTKSNTRPKQKPTKHLSSFSIQNRQTPKPQKSGHLSFESRQKVSHSLDKELQQQPPSLGAHPKGPLPTGPHTKLEAEEGVVKEENDQIYYYYNRNDNDVTKDQKSDSDGVSSSINDPAADAYGPINRASPYDPYKHSLKPVVGGADRPRQDGFGFGNDIKRSEERNEPAVVGAGSGDRHHQYVVPSPPQSRRQRPNSGSGGERRRKVAASAGVATSSASDLVTYTSQPTLWLYVLTLITSVFLVSRQHLPLWLVR